MSMRVRSGVAALLTCVFIGAGGFSSGAKPATADTVYHHGYIYTVDAHDSVRQALAIRDGRFVYVGDEAGVAPFIGPKTTVVDLHGGMVMPGLVDGHMHPLMGGASLMKCNLNYLQLTVQRMQAMIQDCLDATRSKEPDVWLEVVNWFQEGMVPAGFAASRSVLDELKTERPIVVKSSFGHSSLINSRAIAIAGLTSATPDPLSGRIARDVSGNPTGLLDDAAQDLLKGKMPAPTAEDDLKSAKAALDAMRKQGITTFLDAMAVPPTLVAFSRLQHEGLLTARAHFALLITPQQGRDPAAATASVAALAKQYDGGPIRSEPGITVRNVKLFLDGVIAAPALSGAMLQPYFEAVDGHWSVSKNRGPDVYFPAPILRALLIDVVGAGFEPHMHADGDRAVHEGLDGTQALRKAYPGKDVRVAIAHDEIVDPADFARYRRLNAIPVLSFQWEKRASDTVDNAEGYLGPARFRYIEPAGFLAAAGARIAYGSDWPVDPLDEWFALKVGVTRTNAPQASPQYAGRLSEDVGLSRQAVLRAITLNSSYELHQEALTGSIEAGKLADLIVLDRNVLEIPADDIANVHVLRTVVGGAVVYSDEQFTAP